MKDTVIVVTNNGMGNAGEKLQLTWIAKYLDLLLQNDNLPAAGGMGNIIEARTKAEKVIFL